MSAEIMPFPRARDSRFVQRHAWNYATTRPDIAEKHLRAQMKLQLDVMLRRGVDPELAEQHRSALEVAVRCAAARLSASGGVA